MRFAAAALMAGLVFLAGVLSGFGSSSLGPRDFPQAIRLSGATDQVASPEVSASTPGPQGSAAAAGSPGTAVAVVVGHNVVPVPVGTPAAASQHAGTGTSGASSGAASSTEQVPAPVSTAEAPVVSTAFSPVPPSPTPTPTPARSARPPPGPTSGKGQFDDPGPLADDRSTEAVGDRAVAGRRVGRVGVCDPEPCDVDAGRVALRDCRLRRRDGCVPGAGAGVQRSL